MITEAPLPGWKNIFRSFFYKQYSPSTLALQWQREGDIAGWLSRTAWSLALISEWQKAYNNKPTTIVWVPDYFCNASLTPLRETGAKLVFYPVTAEMLPDHAICKQMVEQESPDIFILVHYFGKPSSTRTITDFCASHKIWLIEDAAHVLKPVKGVGTIGDFVLYSPHKQLPIPDGALLIICPEGPAKLRENAVSMFGLPETWPSQLGELQKKMGSLVMNAETKSIVWFCKRVLQKFNIKFWHTTALPFTESLEKLNTLLPLIGPCQSTISKKLLTGLILDLNTFARKRQRNQLLLDELLLSPSHSLSRAERPFIREWAPYLSGYITLPDKGEAEYNHLRTLGMPISTWPDLAPEVIINKEHFTNAWMLRHERIYIGVHQSIQYSELIKKTYKQDAHSEISCSVSIDWQISTKENWQDWLNLVGKSNLLQSWEYGHTKSVQEGWNVKRGVFFLEKEPVAIIQVLEKKYFKILTINRVNRGPLLLRNLTDNESYALYKELAFLGNYLKARILFIAPETPLSGKNLLLMEHSGFKQFALHPWESFWIDLCLEKDVLRKRLDGKWRNMLNFSEKSGLEMKVGEDDELFNWIMEHYRELKFEKNFDGLSIDFLSHFREGLSGKCKLLIFRAVLEDNNIAGICVICHGLAATYLIGWNGQLGRTLKANQFLLWNAIVHLKQLGIKHFDLGGINEVDVPGITAFKSGLNGDFYELVGEYIKW
jgi:hypothetical protein